MAEAVFRHLVAERDDAADWQIDSAGTGPWHVGEEPDPRTVATCRAHGIAIDGRGRQVQRQDFSRYDHILAMDQANLDALGRFKGPAQVRLLRDFDPEGAGDIGDPYYGGDQGFERVFEQVMRSCRGFLQDH